MSLYFIWRSATHWFNQRSPNHQLSSNEFTQTSGYHNQWPPGNISNAWFVEYFMMTSSNGYICRVTDPLCGEIPGPRRIPPHKGQWRGALMVSLICAWINALVNNGEAGDLRRHLAHYDVILMCLILRIRHLQSLQQALMIRRWFIAPSLTPMIKL